MVSEVGREMGILDKGGDRRGEGAVFEVNSGRPICNQRGLCCIVARERRALPKLLWGGLGCSWGYGAAACGCRATRLSFW